MGLPLFVEPVASEVRSKTPTKNGATSPSRPDPRRQARSEIRDRRNGLRRAGVRIYGAVPRPQPRNGPERFLPWAQPSTSGDPDSSHPATYRRSGVFQDALRELGVSDSRRREPIDALLNHAWQDLPLGAGTAEHESMSEGVDLGWWSVESRPSQTTRARLAPLIQARFDRSPDGRLPPATQNATPTVARESTTARTGEVSANQPRFVQSLSARQTMPSRRGALGLDGLGDRQRSLSPDGWDTLHSTMTPDPQPSSAGSSFASIIASQSGGPSSGTSTTAPDMTEGTLIDAPCESACEGSDMDMDEADYEHPDFARIRRQRAEVANLDGMADGLFPRRLGIPGTARPIRQIRTPHGPLTIYESTGRFGTSINPARVARLTRTASEERADLLVDAGENAPENGRRGAEGLRNDQEEHAASTRAIPMASGDDWAGMQRIVRSLARREDIPDGWWAEAGLSRILQQREAAASRSPRPNNDA